MPTKLIIDEIDLAIWLLTDDVPPYVLVGDCENKVIYSASTGEFLGYRTKLIHPELEVYRLEKNGVRD